MRESKSDSDIVRHGTASVSHERTSSEPVTSQERAHVIEITDMDQFKRMTKAQAKELKSVTFRGIKVNEEFVDKFWELFYEGVDELVLDRCTLAGETRYNDLFLGGSHVRTLEISNCDLSDDDAVKVFCNIYPWLLISVKFCGKGLCPAYITSELKRSSALSPEGVLSINVSTEQ